MLYGRDRFAGLHMLKASTLPALVALLFSACTLSSDPADDPVDDEQLVGPIWRVDSIQTLTETTIVARLYHQMTMQFSKEMEVTGFAPCNDYSGAYVIPEHGHLEISALTVSQDTCIGLNVIEDSFVQSLETITAYTMDDGRLSLYDQDREHVISLSIGLVDQALFEDLLDTAWQADSLDHPEEKVVYADTYPTIQFSNRLRVKGFDACGWYEGIYTIDEMGTIAIDILAITANACARRPDLLAYLFHTAIYEATTYELNAGRFIMQDSDGQYVLYFSGL